MAQDPEIDEKQIELELRGKALVIYWYMLTNSQGDFGVREIQRALDYSSPSIVSHHLQKLIDLGLVEKTLSNRYFLRKMVKVGVLKHFTQIRGILLPRYVFVAVFFTFTLISYLFFIFIGGVNIGPFDRLLVLALCIIGGLFGWFETWRLYKLRIL
ncbi:MAG: ArsR family transcriptional regulator [Candidatus Hodarchaeota archaeon]